MALATASSFALVAPRPETLASWGYMYLEAAAAWCLLPPLLLLALLLALAAYELATFRPFQPSAKRARSLGHRRFHARDLPEGRIDVLVIGSGPGGLSCAAVLAQFAKVVVVLEQHEVPGGGAHTFSVAGHPSPALRFNAGHHLSIPLHQQVLQLACGARHPPVKFVSRRDPDGASDRVALAGDPAPGDRAKRAGPVAGGDGAPLGSGEAAARGGLLESSPLAIKDDVWVRDELARRFPAHARAIRAYYELADALQLRFALLVAANLAGLRASALLGGGSSGAGGGGGFGAGGRRVGPSTGWRGLGSWLAPFARWPFALWRKWAGQTSEAGLRAALPGEDEAARRLRSYAIGLWLDVGSPPSRSSFFMQTAVFGGWQKVGVAYPEGSPQATALAMVEAVETRGGRVFVRCPVTAILQEAKEKGGESGGGGSGGRKAVGVRLACGRELRADRVVSGLGYRVTEQLLRAGAPEGTPQEAADTSKAAKAAKATGESSGPRRRSQGASQAGGNPPFHVPPPPPPPPLPPLHTAQGCGFVMLNVGLEGTARELGITSSNLWIQPAAASNGWDALKGVREYMADPLGVPPEMIPVGICFPSTKDGQHEGEGEGARQHTCQVLAPAEWAWFAPHAPPQVELDDPAQPWARHAKAAAKAPFPAAQARKRGEEDSDGGEEHANEAVAGPVVESGAGRPCFLGGGPWSNGGGGGPELTNMGSAPAGAAAGAAAGARKLGPAGSSGPLRRDPEGYALLKARWASRLAAALHRHFPKTQGRVLFVDLATPLTVEHFTRPGEGAAIGLDVTPRRFVDPEEQRELDHQHPRVQGLWRAGQDYLMTGQVLAAASGMSCALRLLGPWAALRFAVRAPGLLLARRGHGPGASKERGAEEPARA